VFNERVTGAYLRAMILAVLAVIMGLVGGPATPAQAAEDDTPRETIVVEGVVHINGEPASAGIVVLIEVPETGESCGTATTTEAGSYTVSLEAPCASGEEAVVALQQVEAKKISDPLVLEVREEPLTFNPVFALTPAEVEELPPQPTLTDGDGAVGQALVQRATSVFDEVEDLLIWLLAAGAGLLGFMAVALLYVTNRRYKFLTETFGKLDHTSPDQLKHWVAGMEAEGKIQGMRFGVFRWMVEGLVMSFVVIALIALGAAGKVDAQGIVSVSPRWLAMPPGEHPVRYRRWPYHTPCPRGTLRTCSIQ
jgi:hypothetical protein